MYSKKRIMRMSDAELMSVYHEARGEVYRLYRKDPDMIHIGEYTDAQETMIRTLRMMVKRGFYLPSAGERILLEENKMLKRAVSVKMDYRSYEGGFSGEADIGKYAKVLRRAHPEFEDDLIDDGDDCDNYDDEDEDDDECIDEELTYCNSSIVEPGTEPGGRGAGTIVITFDDGTSIVHNMSSYPKGTRHLLISIVKWASEGSR